MKNPKLWLGEDQRVEFVRPHDVPIIGIDYFEIDVSAGFPKPTEQYIEKKKINLHELLVKNQSTTFLIRVSGVSMHQAGILDKSMLLIDRSIKARDGHVVLAVLNGEFTVKYLHFKENRIYLVPANKAFPIFDVTGLDNSYVWGVTTKVINDLSIRTLSV